MTLQLMPTHLTSIDNYYQHYPLIELRLTNGRTNIKTLMDLIASDIDFNQL